MQQKKTIATAMTAAGIRIGKRGFNNCSIPLSVMFAISSTPVFINPPTVQSTTPSPFNRLSANCLGVMSVCVKFIEILGGFHLASERFIGIGTRESACLTIFIISFVSLVREVRFCRKFLIFFVCDGDIIKVGVQDSCFLCIFF